MEDLKQGMTVPGIVTNITNFGVFVDIGVKQDGLVHISQLSNTYVSDPNSVVKLQQKVMVTVLEVDIARKRISLSMKGVPSKAAPAKDVPAKGVPAKGAPARQAKPAPKAPGPLKPKIEKEEDFQAKLAALKNKFK
jgi:uncharacterized protein